jgi:hypothetical protein
MGRSREERGGRRRAAIAVAALAAVASTIGPGKASVVVAGATIRPGARITRPDVEPLKNRLPYKFYRCTLTFIFRDSRRRLYTGTTAEKDCVPRVGARVYDENGRAFGTAVFREYRAPSMSFTLIRIDRSRYRNVDPSVLGWGGPTGVASRTSVKRGTVILFAGHGFVEGDLKQTQPRAGILASYDGSAFTADSLAELGDSGGPVIDAATGHAVGMISKFGLFQQPPTTDIGPAIERILADLARHGFRLRLVTAPFTPPF